jgi:orotidine-5'-phosphate decarboxylase
MSVDLLQEKIRKCKNPSVLVLEAFPENLPETMEDFRVYYGALLEELKGLVPAVRFGFGSFALGCGLDALSALTRQARELGYYVILDGPEILSAQAAENMARALGDPACPWVWDGLVLSPWLGSDVMKPFQPLCGSGKAVFCAIRTGNKSASQLQDLLSGGRLAHTAAADIVTRHGEGILGKCGYSNLAATAPAGSADSLRTLRTKYSRLFLLVDGYDYSFGNSKNCAQAFDKLGHGAAICAGQSITAAWKEAEGKTPLEAAADAAGKMKKNLLRYVTVL